MKLLKYIDINYTIIINYFNGLYADKFILKSNKQKTRPYDDDNATSIY